MKVKLTDPTRAAHAVIDTGSLARNLERIRTVSAPARIMAVIKANAYGHGLLRTARSLGAADAFAVARTDEGLALRQGGVRQRIAVLQGFSGPEELQAHADAGLEPVIHSPWQVELLEQTKLPAPLRVWLKVDTGMHRLGSLPGEFRACLARLQACPSVTGPIPVMSHLARADEVEDGFTEQQLALFQDVTRHAAAESSVANSAGLLAWEKARTEWVRPGISLYGVSPFTGRTGREEGLEPVMTLKTRLISVKPLQAGARVGYGGDWLCDRPTRLGIAAIGYGDGYPRHARSGTPALVRGHRVSLIGRVSMDMIALDLENSPEARIGDEVTLWGDGLPVEEIASCASTIPYALLCGLTQRVNLIEKIVSSNQ